MNVEVRRVGPEAAAEVAAVVKAAFSARPPLDPPADALAEDASHVAAELRDHGGLLATVDGRPVGSVLLLRDRDTLWLRRFGVLPDAQGLGIANALLEAITGPEEWAVLARVELPGTIDFWTRRGFVEVDRRSPYVELRRPAASSYDVPDAEAMQELGARVGRALRAGDLVLLTGELGAGKTTFTQGLGEGLGVRPGITSPTFVISRIHPSLGEGPDLVHVDAYRLGGAAELDDLDLDASLDEAVTVVEWGTGVAEQLADSRLEVVITRAVADEATDELDSRRVELRRVGAQ
ncbi:tRNA (adenosine(37)-N6)-threonylcarbamoyltransferase complex ATPase subunit type 1 TsaE [Nocardioides gansuensis]|uniref:tRNA threonylcarbamoyladenosine biosynthesis protein TsaE n=1 Tax=Nocardioides gansuensis TaxID=2138300 RepID=A0A2T8FG57_9ACTN|nr:tRNA (adenosine(37)-N6)-threonylcarbamoyltransferase complex ATPase subunit type 1 TsaE [Nocardioides gansuensis]PVG84702.1 tRNA (adenosine(37)-N6)-threonylcarbamoyltransferase complex ATPase subunit type 1 TsaE [Nocardioides gansuensis]